MKHFPFLISAVLGKKGDYPYHAVLLSFYNYCVISVEKLIYEPACSMIMTCVICMPNMRVCNVHIASSVI